MRWAVAYRTRSRNIRTSVRWFFASTLWYPLGCTITQNVALETAAAAIENPTIKRRRVYAATTMLLLRHKEHSKSEFACFFFVPFFTPLLASSLYVEQTLGSFIRMWPTHTHTNTNCIVETNARWTHRTHRIRLRLRLQKRNEDFQHTHTQIHKIQHTIRETRKVQWARAHILRFVCLCVPNELESEKTWSLEARAHDAFTRECGAGAMFVGWFFCVCIRRAGWRTPFYIQIFIYKFFSVVSYAPQIQ